MLVELSVMEQRYHAVMEVVSGAPVSDTNQKSQVSRRPGTPLVTPRGL